MHPAVSWAETRTCSPIDFQSCKSCDQLASAVSLKEPDSGEYYRGAEWNGLYAAYVLNCPIVAAKLLEAGANPASGGTWGSLIMTVAGKWPHNSKQVNEAWAALLLSAGADMDTSLNWRDHKNTKEVLAEELSYRPDYPDLLVLFQK